MERGRRLAIGAVGLAVMLLTTGLLLRSAGDGGQRIDTTAAPTTIEALSGDLPDVGPDNGVEPGAPPISFDPSVPPGLEPAATLPAPGVATIPLPNFGTGRTTPTTAKGTTPSVASPVFDTRGVWVVGADGSNPVLVGRDGMSGVAAGGTWVAFVTGGTVRAARRSDLRSTTVVATGVSGSAAQGLPISGGRRGVAFVQGGKAVLVDPAAPASPLVAYDAPQVEAVAAEEDGAGRLVWADAQGLHVGTADAVAPDDHVQRGMLVMGHGVLAHLQDGQVAVRNGPRLSWGDVDRLHAGPGGLVAASGGRVRLHTPDGQERVLLERATTPVVTSSRILYVSQGKSLASASLTGSGATTVASASAGRTITNLDLLDDSTVVVTVA